MTSGSTQPSATENNSNSVLKPVVTLKGHKTWYYDFPDREHQEWKFVSSICYFPDGKQMISGSGDNTIRRWELREGKEIEKAREVCENRIRIVGVSKDGRWVVILTIGEQLKSP
ncbi:hypothetical protein BDR04DRAFT_1094564 [Suillus decipiens]|nr:hypothetical protein BDR04DRAFT_1094564 [Suillus decipiens]